MRSTSSSSTLSELPYTLWVGGTRDAAEGARAGAAGRDRGTARGLTQSGGTSQAQQGPSARPIFSCPLRSVRTMSTERMLSGVRNLSNRRCAMERRCSRKSMSEKTGIAIMMRQSSLRRRSRGCLEQCEMQASRAQGQQAGARSRVVASRLVGPGRAGQRAPRAALRATPT